MPASHPTLCGPSQCGSSPLDTLCGVNNPPESFCACLTHKCCSSDSVPVQVLSLSLVLVFYIDHTHKLPNPGPGLGISACLVAIAVSGCSPQCASDADCIKSRFRVTSCRGLICLPGAAAFSPSTEVRSQAELYIRCVGDLPRR